MKAMLVKEEDRSLVWSDVEDPVVKEDSVLIEIHAAALNRADLMQREGHYPSPKGCPPWMGLEVSGIVKEIGEKVTRFKPGDKVTALLGGGGYAEYVAADEGMVMPIPAGLSFVEAASLPEAYATCYLNLLIEGRMKPGETVFFPGGNSGLASVGIPMAKAFGAYVITSVRRSEYVEKIAYLQADRVIDQSKEDLLEALKAEAEQGHPIDVAIDYLGGPLVGNAFPYVNPGCRWIILSSLAGTETTVPLRPLLMKGIELKGSTLRRRSVQEKSDILASLVRDVWPKIESGEIRPGIHAVLPMEKAAEAQDILYRGDNVGKVVLTLK